MDRRIIIVGFMGSGKSTVARALSRRLNSVMIDLDTEIANTEGRSPKQIIEQEGESAFRRIESNLLERVLKEDSAQVIALGGGAWTVPSNRDVIAKSGATSVWLDAPFALCWQRIVESGSERPLARNESQARVLYEERRASYGSAELHMNASENKAPDQIANEVIQALQGCDI
jgi:shikimate kinase